MPPRVAFLSITELPFRMLWWPSFVRTEMMFESRGLQVSALAAAVLFLFNCEISSSILVRLVLDLGSFGPLTCWNVRSLDVFIVD